MNKEKFMNELEYLLQDIPNEEKRDAIEYYRDYLDEAGPDMEEKVLTEFGSPERIAAMIRSDLSGHLEEGGEFTESGYEDPRFKDPNYQVAKRYDLPQEQEDEKKSDARQQEAGKGKHRGDENKPWTNKILKIVLLVVLIIVAAPVLLGVGGSVLGLAVGLLVLLFGLFLAAGALTLGAVIAGVVLLVFGIVHMAVNILNGFFCVGIGLVFLGIGWFFLALSIAFYGRFLPWVIVGIINFFNRIINGGRRKKTI